MVWKGKFMTHEDFNMSEINPNGSFVRVNEINEMTRCGVISIDG